MKLELADARQAFREALDERASRKRVRALARRGREKPETPAAEKRDAADLLLDILGILKTMSGQLARFRALPKTVERAVPESVEFVVTERDDRHQRGDADCGNERLHPS